MMLSVSNLTENISFYLLEILAQRLKYLLEIRTKALLWRLPMKTPVSMMDDRRSPHPIGILAVCFANLKPKSINLLWQGLVVE